VIDHLVTRTYSRSEVLLVQEMLRRAESIQKFLRLAELNRKPPDVFRTVHAQSPFSVISEQHR
jgi:hypothetical protein